MTDLRANLRRGRGFPVNHGLLAVKHNTISRHQLPAATGLHHAVDADLSCLDPLFRFSAGKDQALPFEELIQLHRREIND